MKNSILLLTLLATVACEAPPEPTTKPIAKATEAAAPVIQQAGSLSSVVGWLVAGAVILALLGLAAGLVVWYFKKVKPDASETQEAFDRLETSLLHIQKEQRILAADYADLKRKHDGLAEILLAFIEDLQTARHRLEILQNPDYQTIQGGASFYYPKLSALIGALDDGNRQSLIMAETGLLQAEVQATSRYVGIILNRVIATRGIIAHTSYKLRKTGAVALLRQMDNTYQACEERLYQLNEPGYVALYDKRLLGPGDER